MSLALPYDSEQARTLASAISAILTGTAYTASAELASVKGPFEKYRENAQPMLNVINMHREHCKNISEVHCPEYLLKRCKRCMGPGTRCRNKIWF